MYVPPEVKRRIRIACLVVPFVLPGWRGDLVPVPNDQVILASAQFDAGDVFGTSRPGEREGEEWHAQYMGSGAARFLDLLGLRRFATHLVPPAFAAHIPPGSDKLPHRADGYYRVETHLRWPWWWPGGGVDWRVPGE